MQMTSPYIVGPPVEDPADFYGRKGEIDRFFENLNGGQLQSVHVVGVQRSGKTSFLKHVSHPDVFQRNILVRQDKQILATYVDLAGVAVPEDFYLLVAKALVQALPSCEPRKCPERLGSMRAFDHWLDKLGPLSCQWVILLDEFDALREKSSFTVDFFDGLRSFINSFRIAWVTCSHRDLYRISQVMGLREKTSPLFNAFYPDSIMIGALSTPDARSLVLTPAERCGFEISHQEIDMIIELAGRLPYFIQAAADKWLRNAQHEETVQERKERIAGHLLRSLRRRFEGIWSQLNETERRWLHKVATQSMSYDGTLPASDDTLNDLKQYGLLDVCGEHLCIAGSVFEKWIQREALAYDKRSSHTASYDIPHCKERYDVSRLRGTPPGAVDAEMYAQCVFEILRGCLAKQLSHPERESKTVNGTERRDIVFYNNSSHKFWQMVGEKYGCTNIVFECKNTEKLEPDHINQLAEYLGRPLGRFGVIVSRLPPEKNLQRKAVTVFNRNQKVILFLSDDDLAEMAQLDAQGQDPTEVIERKYVQLTRAVQ
jgi:hypothetical protein